MGMEVSDARVGGFCTLGNLPPHVPQHCKMAPDSRYMYFHLALPVYSNVTV